MTLFARIATRPKTDLNRGYSRPMGETSGPAHAGLSGYGLDERGGLREALKSLDNRMGIFGEYRTQQDRTVPMRVAIYSGVEVGKGPDSEELFRPNKLLTSRRTDAAQSFDEQYARLYRDLVRAGINPNDLEW